MAADPKYRVGDWVRWKSPNSDWQTLGCVRRVEPGEKTFDYYMGDVFVAEEDILECRPSSSSPAPDQ